MERRPLWRVAIGFGIAAFAVAFAGAGTAAHAGDGFQSFAETGGPQAFTVPQGVDSVIVDLFGAAGGTTDVTQPPAVAPGGETTETVATTTSALEVVVGGRGVDGTANGAGPGGFNGGGDGSTDVDGCCPGGAGGGGATDVRSGSCASGLTCTVGDRVAVAGGGGGAGGGADQGEPGGAGGGTTGANGSDATDSSGTATGGGGANQTMPGVAGTGSAAGTVGDTPDMGDGGPGGGGVGGGGGGGWHGGGSGASTNAPNGAGGGGGSGFASAPSNLQGAQFSTGDGSAVVYWLTSSSLSPSSGTPVTLTAHVAADAAGGTETFTEGSAVLCSAVPVASDGTAQCASSFAAGSHTISAAYTDQPTPRQAQFNGLSESTTITAVPVIPPTPATGARPAPPATLLGVVLAGGVASLSVAVAAYTSTRRRRT
ncbi:MAG: Ig-like domain-containing protein [Candidatus Dormibacteria bacterium]